MDQTTYLIGAGASYYALPIVSDIPEKYDEFVAEMERLLNILIEQNKNSFPAGIPTWERDLLGKLKSFSPGIHSHSSIDTYAKKLFLTKNGDLASYKFCLSLFLTYEQNKNGLDKRYDTFLASILETDITNFPCNLNVLSWNYDTQFELSYYNYFNKSLKEINDVLNVVTKFDKSSFSKNLNNVFSIVKLNGSIGISNRDGSNFEYLYPHYRTLSAFCDYDVKIFLDRHKTMDEKKSCLSFAWEEAEEDRYSPVGKAMEITANTKTLVIIGYSFPYFNRKVDRAIFDSMPSLSKIYIQDIRAHDIVQKVHELCLHYEHRAGFPDIIPFTDCSQFLIPNELN